MPNVQHNRFGFWLQASIHRGWWRSNRQSHCFHWDGQDVPLPFNYLQTKESRQRYWIHKQVYFWRGISIKLLWWFWHQSFTFTGWGHCGLWLMPRLANQTKPPTVVWFEWTPELSWSDESCCHLVPQTWYYNVFESCCDFEISAWGNFRKWTPVPLIVRESAKRQPPFGYPLQHNNTNKLYLINLNFFIYFPFFNRFFPTYYIYIYSTFWQYCFIFKFYFF